LLLVGAGFARADEQQAIPRLAARVTDLAGTLAAEQRGSLEAKLAAFESAKGLADCRSDRSDGQPETIEQYALRVVESWKLGRRGADDGALLLVAMGRQEGSHRSRLRSRGRAQRCNRQANHQRDHQPAFQAGRFLPAALMPASTR
jgi:uncharacterized membrane protein YgcG